MGEPFKDRFVEAKQEVGAAPFSALHDRGEGPAPFAPGDPPQGLEASASYDYIVLGAGSAGSIVGAELARRFPGASVALVEAGPAVPAADATVWDPTQWALISKIPELEWGYQSVLQAGLDNRVIPMGRSKGLGGCALHNAMVYVRGGSLGYDHWADKLGCPGWDYANNLPFFEQVEASVDITIAGGDDFMVDLIRAGENHGLTFNPNYNQNLNEACVSPFQFAISAAGRRETSFSAYLAEQIPNLFIGTGWTVEKIVVDGSKTARSVVLRHGGSGDQIELGANREIILAAGAFGSPQVLMLSGIGPAAELAAAGVPLIQDTPGVGKNLQDDLFVTAAFMSKQPLPPQPYGLMGSVIFANSPNNREGLGTDIECSMAAGTMAGMGLPPEQQQSYFIYPNIQLLKSRGTVTLASSNPFQAPVIDPKYLSAPGDLQNCIDALKLAIEIGSDSAMAPWMESEMLPADPGGDLEAYVRQTAGTCYHYAGTCKMGTDPMAVVSPDLRVRGINNLRVIDSSVIPQTVSGNTAAATMMIAAKGSAIIAQGG